MDIFPQKFVVKKIQPCSQCDVETAFPKLGTASNASCREVNLCTEVDHDHIWNTTTNLNRHPNLFSNKLRFCPTHGTRFHHPNNIIVLYGYNWNANVTEQVFGVQIRSQRLPRSLVSRRRYWCPPVCRYSIVNHIRMSESSAVLTHWWLRTLERVSPRH
jgi:hypothetical protein